MFTWIADVLAGTGYFGIVGLMFLENLFPPIPSEVIMPLAGFTAARGELSLLGVILAGMGGSLLGALPWYYAGWWLGEARLRRLAGRYGRWFTVSARDIDKAAQWFDRHGRKVVFLGRLIPTIRTLISVPAGIARMNLAAFLSYSALGTVLWSGLLAYADNV